MLSRIARDIRTPERRPVHDRQRGRHRSAQSVSRHDLRPAGQHRRPRVRPTGHDGLRAEKHLEEAGISVRPSRISVTPVSFMSGGGMSAASVQYMIGGPDMNKLEQYAKAVMKDLRQVPGAVDVDSSLSAGKPQYGIRVDRPKAAELGVSIADIANTLAAAGGRRQSVGLSRPGRAIRSPRPLDRRRPQPARRTEDGHGSVEQVRHGSAGRRGSIREGNRPGADQPPRPHAPSHDQRQPHARHLGTRRARRHRTRPRRA